MNNKIFIDALQKKPGTPPIWLMRQAGRYLPEYKKLREKAGSFLNLCYSPELATEVTLQPIKRFGFDASIIFSDILIVPHSLGIDLDFKEGEGPVLKKISKNSELLDLEITEKNWQFEKIWETVSKVKNELPKNVALIGFAGAPWTVATYIIEGKGKTDFALCKKFIKEQPDFVKKLIDIITEQTIYYLIGQIKAGAEVIQIFDTWAGILNEEGYKEFVEKPTAYIIFYLRKLYPEILFIGFPKNIGKLSESYIKNIYPDAISIDSDISAEYAKELQKLTVIQGNLDPVVLLQEKNNIKKHTTDILNNFAGKNFIFNLGHGILPETPVENVEFLVDIVRNYEK